MEGVLERVHGRCPGTVKKHRYDVNQIILLLGVSTTCQSYHCNEVRKVFAAGSPLDKDKMGVRYYPLYLFGWTGDEL